MQAYSFTERCRRVVAEARAEAAALAHPYVGCEHLLLALLAADGIVSVVLKNLGLDRSETAQTFKQGLRLGDDGRVTTGIDVPYTTRAITVLELAMTEARLLNHSYLGTEHLLLGLLRDGKGVAAEALYTRGITIEKARAETFRVLGGENV